MNSLLEKQQQARQRKLQKLLRRPDLWRGESSRFARLRTLDTGHEALNRLLVRQGWPLRGLIELAQEQPGHGEWQLLAKGLQHLLQEPGYLVLLNPPAQLHLPGLAQLHLDYRRILVIEPRDRADLIYSFKVAAASPACNGLIGWESGQLPNSRPLPYPELRKLQLAAANGSGLFVLIRNTETLQQNSPACLRLHLRADTGHFAVQVCKQRGTFKPQGTTVDMPSDWLPLPALSSPAWLTDTPNPSGQVLSFNPHL